MIKQNDSSDTTSNTIALVVKLGKDGGGVFRQALCRYFPCCSDILKNQCEFVLAHASKQSNLSNEKEDIDGCEKPKVGFAMDEPIDVHGQTKNELSLCESLFENVCLVKVYIIMSYRTVEDGRASKPLLMYVRSTCSLEDRLATIFGEPVSPDSD